MTLSIAGIGMVSPAGVTARDHVFFTRASGVLAPAPSPFLNAAGERVEVRYCPWIGARARASERLSHMALAAIEEALAPFEEANPGERIPLLLCTAAPRPGLSKADVDAVAGAARERLRAPIERRFEGEAGAFAALNEAEELLATRRETRAVLVLGADSHVALDAVIEHVRRPPSYWSDDVPEPSEGAAALLLTAHPAPRGSALATFHGAALATGAATDDNDLVVDGAALTAALRSLRSPGPIGLALGQEHVDEMRRREWSLASARNQGRFRGDCALETIEKHVGRVGAASGAMSLAFGVALAIHEAVANAELRRAPFLAWAISRDGTRGAAVAQGHAT